MRIPLKDIYIGDRQRKDYGKTEMDELKADLKENGQIQAITVRPPNDDDRSEEDYEGQPWVLIAGGRRLNAAWMNGWEDIEGFAREEMSTLVANILELHENIKRKPMTWQEQVEAKAQITRLRRMENPEIEDWEIAKELGETPANLSRDLKTAEMIETNPGLRKAGSKGAALNAGKILAENKQRAALAQQNAAGPVSPSVAGDLEARVKTSEALPFTQALAADSIDLTLIDGPYGYNYWKQGQKAAPGAESHISAYDDDPKTVGPMYKALVPELVRVTRPTGWLVMFCGKETYDFLESLLQDCCASHGAYRHDQYTSQCTAVAGKPNAGDACRFLSPNPYPWYWHRPNSRNRPRYPHLHAQNVVELMLVCNMGKGRLVKQGTNLFIEDADYGKDRVHANQKPIGLYRQIIERFTFTGDSILDTFFGSGNSLAAAASLGRIPWGCDKNQEMLPFALGSIRRLQQTVTSAAVKASFERYQKNLANPLAPTDLLEEELEAEASGPREITRKDGEVWEYEIFRIGQEFIGYFKYDGHNMGQRRSKDGDALEMQMADLTQKLETLSTLRIIDPCCCTPEEAMDALRAVETAEAEAEVETKEDE